MRTLRYVTVDVFTPVPFSGNQLAVVFDAEGLSTETLQALTREFNYAESSFVLPPTNETMTRRVRIFTPEMEVPFAGHPTIGTAHVLVATGAVPTSAPARNAHESPATNVTVVLGENVGNVPVRVELVNGQPVHAEFTTAQLPEERGAAADREALAAVLGLNKEDLLDSNTHRSAAVSCGLPFHIIPLRSVEAVSRATLNRQHWERVLAGHWAPWPMVFAMTAGSADNGGLPPHVQGCDIRARVFVPGSTVPEDPATGSANAALAGYLAARTPRNGALSWRVAQGLELGRPGRLSIAAEKQDGNITAVRVGGNSVVICEGTIRLQSA